MPFLLMRSGGHLHPVTPQAMGEADQTPRTSSRLDLGYGRHGEEPGVFHDGSSMKQGHKAPETRSMMLLSPGIWKLPPRGVEIQRAHTAPTRL